MGLQFPAEFLAEQRDHNAGVLASATLFERPRALDLEELRRARDFHRDGSPRHQTDPAALDHELMTSCGTMRVRRFNAAAPRGLAIHFHGGGWALGSIYAQDLLLRNISQGAGLDVLSVDYPLAPETALPGIIEASQAALTAILQQNRGRQIVLIGESAGAHLALASLLALRNERERIGHIRAMVLSYGIYDLAMTPSQISWGSRFLGLSTPWLEYFYELALPGVGRELRRSPDISPLYADLAGLPPALFAIGKLDPLLDDSVMLHRRWLAAGNVGRIDIYPEAGHGFNHTATAMAAHANDATCAFLAAHLADARRER